MKKQASPTHKPKDSTFKKDFAAFPLSGLFALADLLAYPSNFLIALIPLLIAEGILVMFFLRKLNKKHQPTEMTAKEPELAAKENIPAAPKPKPKVKGIPVGKAEVVGEMVKFSVAKGFFKKSWVTLKEVPVFEIVGINSFGNELTVTWKDLTESFVFKKKGESFSKLHAQIEGLLEEHKKMLESQEKATQRKTDLTSVLNASVGVVDLSFDILMSLQVKKVDWSRLEAYADGLGTGLSFSGQTLAPLNVDFSIVTSAIKNRTPKDASKEAFTVLKLIHEYFDGLNLDEDIAETHPNFKDARAVIFAYYTLNDLLLAKIVGEKDIQNESNSLELALEGLANETNVKVNLEELRGSIDKMSVGAETDDAVSYARDIFKEQLRQL